jgi:hypothetical protein
MIAMTTSNSISVNAEENIFVLFIFIGYLGNEAGVIVVFAEQVNKYFDFFSGEVTTNGHK